MKRLLAGQLALLAAGAALLARGSSPPGPAVSVVVTAEPRSGKTIPPLLAEDVAVNESEDKRPVTSLESLNGTKMQLLMMIDDSASTSFNTEIPALKQFTLAQPANVEIGIGYMRNGMTQMACGYTLDHAAAARAIRLPLGPGGADTSPYDSLTEAVKKWPKEAASRREIVMISSGIEGLGGGFAPENQYVNAGIESAQKAGIVVYTIYNPQAGHWGHSYWRSTWGQNFLAQLSDETGGEFYTIGFGPAVSFEPFLEAITAAFEHQYRLTFVARAQKKAGLQPLHIQVVEKNASLAAPDRVFVPAGL